MEIGNVTSVGGENSSASQVAADLPARQSPPVTVSTADTSRMAEMARTAQRSVATLRTVRLARIEKAIHEGNYQPSASQIANRLLDAAEIDSHMQAMLRG